MHLTILWTENVLITGYRYEDIYDIHDGIACMVLQVHSCLVGSYTEA